MKLKRTIQYLALAFLVGLGSYQTNPFKATVQNTAKKLEQKINENFRYEQILENVKNKEGKPALKKEDIKLLKIFNIPLDYAQTLAKDFSCIEIYLFHSKGISLDYINSLKDICDGTTIYDLYSLGVITPGEIELLKSVKRNDKPIWNGNDIRRIIYDETKIRKIKEKDAETLQGLADVKDEKGGFKFSSLEVRILYKLGFDKDNLPQFKDGKKPNAIIVYPTSDWNGAFETEASIKLYDKIKNQYDTKMIITGVEQKVYEAINSTPDVKLLILSGHGSPEILSLGDKDPRIAEGQKSEEYKIDKSDNEFSMYLNKLDPDAVIFLNSCSNADGGKDKENLANFVSKYAGGRKVIASKVPFSGSDVTVKSLYPFNVQIKVEGKDVTYSIRK